MVTPPMRDGCLCGGPRYWHRPVCPFWEDQPDYPHGHIPERRKRYSVEIPKQQRGGAWAPWTIIALGSLALISGIVGALEHGGAWDQRIPYLITDLLLIALGIYWLIRR